MQDAACGFHFPAGCCDPRPLPHALPSRARTGTVIPAQDSVFAAASVGDFKQQMGGQGFFVVGPLAGQLLGAAASVQLVNPAGTVVASS